MSLIKALLEKVLCPVFARLVGHEDPELVAYYVIESRNLVYSHAYDPSFAPKSAHNSLYAIVSPYLDPVFHQSALSAGPFRVPPLVVIVHLNYSSIIIDRQKVLVCLYLFNLDDSS